MKRGIMLATAILVSTVLIPHTAEARKRHRVVKPEAAPCFIFCEVAPVTHKGKLRAVRSNRRISTTGLVAPLRAKAAEIASECGSVVVSGLRHTYIAGTRRISLHASGQAVDMVGNPKCIYAHLRGWPGGYSIDYARARHVHISWTGGGREWGVRFAHGGAKHHRRATRHARHHQRAHRREASAAPRSF